MDACTGREPEDFPSVFDPACISGCADAAAPATVRGMCAQTLAASSLLCPGSCAARTNSTSSGNSTGNSTNVGPVVGPTDNLAPFWCSLCARDIGSDTKACTADLGSR